MNGAFFDGSLVLNRGDYRYCVDLEGKVLTIRASVAAMIALKRELGTYKRQITSNTIADALTKLNMLLKWKLGPLRLTLFTPSGPSLLSRIMKF